VEDRHPDGRQRRHDDDPESHQRPPPAHAPLGLFDQRLGLIILDAMLRFFEERHDAWSVRSSNMMLV
jgi:hypothetical protein